MPLLSPGGAARRSALLAAAALWLTGAHATHAIDRFVSTTGNNSWPGTAAQPWATLQHAADVVTPGTRVVVRPGDYTGFYLDRDGTAANPIEFFAEPGVRITQDNGVTDDGINLELASHIIIDGFEVFGMGRAGVRTVGLDDDFAEFVTIRNVHAHENGVWGIFTGHVNDLLIENNRTWGSISEHGIYVSNSGDRPVIRNNTSFGNRASGIHMNGDLSLGGDGIISNAVVSGNRIYDNSKTINGMAGRGGSGINMDGVQNSRIENNLLYGNRASGISLYQIDGGEPSTGNVVINNTVHQPSNGRWALNIIDGSTGNTVLNNILVSDHSFRGSIAATEDTLAGMVSNHNALADRFTTDTGDTTFGFAAWQDLLDDDAQSFTATAADLFVDSTNANLALRDYRLKPGVLAIDGGTVAPPAPLVDIAGTTRPQGLGVDMGAYEMVTAPTFAAADFNNSGRVDAADLALWQNGFGTSAGATKNQGDANGDGAVNSVDFIVWQRQVSPPSGAATVPEPAGAALAASSLFFVGVGRRRVRQTAYR